MKMIFPYVHLLILITGTKEREYSVRVKALFRKKNVFLYDFEGRPPPKRPFVMFICMEKREFTFEMLQRRAGSGETPFVLWRAQDRFRSRRIPVRVDFPGFFLCVSGRLEIEINLQRHVIDTYKVLCFTTHYTVRIVERSRDFCCLGVIFSRPYWKELVREYAFGTLAVQNAIVPVGGEARGQLAAFHGLLCSCTDSPQGTGGGKAAHHLIAGMLCLVEGICKEHLAAAAPMSRSERLLFDFMELLYKEYRNHRRVSYYARRLSVTPRHLSTVIRQTSGRSASRWIEEYITLEARALLREGTMTVKQIAYELHFNDPSLFSKYFSRVTGLSPEAYRRR